MAMKVERKVFNSVRILDDGYGFLQRQYEFVNNLILSYGGRIHGSQYQAKGQYGSPTIAVYFEVPTDAIGELQKEETAFNAVLQAEILARPKLKGTGGPM
jgi:hypothetical protein